MIPKECKRLAEVDFPIAEVSRHAAREKSIRHGHPSTLHLWWARRPLASSRAMLMALLLPDPCDPHCPGPFKHDARKALLGMRGRPSGWDREIKTDEGLRKILLRFIADFANWNNAANSGYLEAGRALVSAAHPEETPLVVDPFAGGGSIPLEALRLGCETFASDLNPVACLILKVMLEDIPRSGPRLADEIRQIGTEIRAKASEELSDLYPNDPDGAIPIAYLWARTVRCEAPNCGAEIPLMRSLWLSKKPKRKRALRPRVERAEDAVPQVGFEIFEPKTDREVASGTVARARASCLCCGAVLPPERVRAQLAAWRGGADTVFDEEGNRIGGARMTAVVTHKPGEQGRHYRLPTNADYARVHLAQRRIARILDEWERTDMHGPCPVPNEPTPSRDTHRAVGSQFPSYNMATFGDLFTARQKMALVVLVQLTTVVELHRQALSLIVTRLANAGCSLSRWDTSRENHQGIFSRQAFPMVWDFSEGNPLSGSTGGYHGALEWVADVAGAWPKSGTGEVQQADATDHPLPDQSVAVWFTDPPYYDAIPYADLSDFFLVWLKRTLPGLRILHDPREGRNLLSPKSQEIVQCEKVKNFEGVSKDKIFYEKSMANAFAEGRRVLDDEGVGSIVFAHKSTEGWEALLSGIVQGDWTITASWPIATEMGSRLNARDTASLATSVHLVCRPRLKDAQVGDWSDVLRELPSQVGDWMHRLEEEDVRGADLVFACVGPALEIYSRYSRVETADGREVGLPEYLEKVWEVVGREALQQVLGTAEAQARNGAAGALEEDARLTALFLWTMQSTGESDSADSDLGDEDEESDVEDQDDEAPRRKATGHRLPFDVVRRFAQPLGIHLDDWESRIIDTQKGVVRLMPVKERAEHLFDESVVDDADVGTDSPQLSLFPDDPPAVRGRARRGNRATVSGRAAGAFTHAATTLDRVHAAMLLQASGRSWALRNLLRAEQERSPDFLRLANALSALYPRGSEEKRLLDAMLLAVPK